MRSRPAGVAAANLGVDKKIKLAQAAPLLSAFEKSRLNVGGAVGRPLESSVKGELNIIFHNH
jgi:hypothetical protein